MGSSSGSFKEQSVLIHKRYSWGLWGALGANLQGFSGSGPGGGIYETPDAAYLDITTGSTYLPDISYNSGTVSLFPDFNGDTGMGGTAPCVPRGCKAYVYNLLVAVTTDWTGGTAGTVSLTIQDSAGTALVTFTQTALHNASGYVIRVPLTGAVTGVTDSCIGALTTTAAAGKGLQAVAANSTAGVARLFIQVAFAA